MHLELTSIIHYNTPFIKSEVSMPEKKVQLVVKVPVEIRDTLRRFAKEDDRTMGNTLTRLLLAEEQRRSAAKAA